VTGRNGPQRLTRHHQAHLDTTRSGEEWTLVAQVSNLLYRRLPVGTPGARLYVCGLEIRDTADWKSALRWRLRDAPVTFHAAIWTLPDAAWQR
jgi:hypothetical protein